MGGWRKSCIRPPDCLFRLYLNNYRRWGIKVTGPFAIPKKVLCVSGVQKRGARGKKTEAQPAEGEPKSRHSHKGAGGFMQNRRSRGKRMTSEKYATAVVHYLR